ncbi:MAG TPA: hypothetical protein PLY70_03745 [Saprospiraceae bacterium]|nr:hypothetical protein [Saprospiraceae bacterium]
MKNLKYVIGFGIFCAILSIIMLGFSFIVSEDKDYATLYKMALPLLIILLLYVMLKSKK